MIVAQTGWEQKEHREQSEKAGFDYHLVKPVSLDTMKKILALLKEPKLAHHHLSKLKLEG
jgi:CheY-like chemotaxis protein